MGDDLISLDRLDAASPDRVGQKAACLSQLQAAGFPVPPGACITTGVFYQALELLLRGKCRIWLYYPSVILKERRHGTVMQREASTIGAANPDTGAASAHTWSNSK